MASLILSAHHSRGQETLFSHFHDCNQLLVIKEGLADIAIEGHSYSAGNGSLVLISRFEQHAITPLTENYDRYILRIASSTLSSHETENLLFSVLSNRPAPFSHWIDLGDSFPNYLDILEEILAEQEAQNPLCDYMLDQLLFRFLALLYRNHGSLFASNDHHYLGLISRIKNELSQHYDTDYTLESLAAQYHISSSYLAHIFKATTGISIMHYLQACRLASAKQLLATTSLPVGKIVERCGFSDHSNFSRIFKEQLGLSPLAFRHQYQDGK